MPSKVQKKGKRNYLVFHAGGLSSGMSPSSSLSCRRGVRRLMAPHPAPTSFALRTRHPRMLSSMLAACGMNCGICMATLLRKYGKCPGCRGGNKDKSPSCIKCVIKKCAFFRNSKSKFCYSCPKYPCARLKHLDKRYRTKYGMSMIENLANIKKQGLKRFVKEEEKRWACPKCGGVICVHRWFCVDCGHKKLKAKY